MSRSGRAIGLPSNPRSRSVAPSDRRDAPSRPLSSATDRPIRTNYPNHPPSPPLSEAGRSIRPQRSIAALPSAPRSRSMDRSRAEPGSRRAESPPPLPTNRGMGIGALARGRGPAPPRAPASEAGDYRQHRPTASEAGYRPQHRYNGSAASEAGYRPSRHEREEAPRPSRRHEREEARPSHRYEREEERRPHHRHEREEERRPHHHHHHRRNGSDASLSSTYSDKSSLFEGAKGSDVTSTRTSVDAGYPDKDGDKSAEDAAASSLWGRLATVLTVGVGWSGNVTKYDGEETPPGGETRLTRAMKAYHIAQVRNPADLPEWLFTDRERGLGDRSRARAAEAAPAPAPAPAPSRSNEGYSHSRSISTASAGRTTPAPAAAAPRQDGGSAHVVKSMNRLKELREAKRNAQVRFHGGQDDDDYARARPKRSGTPPPAPAPSMPRLDPSAVVSPSRRPMPLGVGTRPRGGGLPSNVRPVRG